MSEKWKVGKYKSTVVSDVKQSNTNFTSSVIFRESTDDEVEFYGGYLVCESIANPKTANLISASNEMLSALEYIVKYWNTPTNGSLNFHIEHTLKIAEVAINKAKGNET